MLLLHDSGIGGLSIARAIRQVLPDEELIYLADYGGFPYGALSDSVLTQRLVRLLGRAVAEHRPDALVVACNTASTVALSALRAALDVPVVGCVPPIKPAAELSRSRAIGLLATEATVRRPYVSELAARFAAGCQVFSHGSANLAALAETAFRGEQPDQTVLRAELDLLLGQDGAGAIDAVALGCTHYAFLLPQLRALAPQIAHWLDPAMPVARQTAAVLQSRRTLPAGPARLPTQTGLALVTALPPPATARGFAAFGFDLQLWPDQAPA